MIKNAVTFSLLFFTTFLYSQVPISDIRINDSNGSPQLLGQSVTVSGVVTSSSSVWNYRSGLDTGQHGRNMCVWTGFPNGR